MGCSSSPRWFVGTDPVGGQCCKLLSCVPFTFLSDGFDKVCSQLGSSQEASVLPSVVTASCPVMNSAPVLHGYSPTIFSRSLQGSPTLSYSHLPGGISFGRDLAPREALLPDDSYTLERTPLWGISQRVRGLKGAPQNKQT